MDYSSLARSYNTLSYTHQLRELLASFFQTEKYNNLTKYELAKTVNNIVFKHYNGEEILKYRLAKEFIKRDYVAAFEVKSKIDTLNRLKKQVADYGDVFEYNTVVIDKSHLEKVLTLIPDYYGVWYYNNGNKIIYRAAQYSPKINPIEQLSLFNKRESEKAFGISEEITILNTHSSKEINDALKNALRGRYKKRWSFLQTNWDIILPIDLQFFFNTNVKPEIIYGL
jgi:hypothetical protein